MTGGSVTLRVKLVLETPRRIRSSGGGRASLEYLSWRWTLVRPVRQIAEHPAVGHPERALALAVQVVVDGGRDWARSANGRRRSVRLPYWRMPQVSEARLSNEAILHHQHDDGIDLLL